MTKPKLTIVLQNKTGGLQFYFTNLVKAGAFDDFEIRYVALDADCDHNAGLTAPLEGAPMEVFYYGKDENLYHMARRLAGLFPRDPGIVITNYLAELTCLDICRRENQTVFHVCHDEAFVEVALRYSHIIDVFIAHNPHFVKVLKSQLPAEQAKNVIYLPFGIHQHNELRRMSNFDRPLKIVFIGRLHRSKGVLDLPLIDDQLREMGISAEWLILGCGPEEENLKRIIENRQNFILESPVDGNAMLRRASTGDVFVLPTRLDGTPLAVMEAMSVGLVPIVSEFNSGAHWMVPLDTGYICPLEPRAFALILAALNADRAELETRSQKAQYHARKEFDVKEKMQRYAEEFANRLGQIKMPPGQTAKYGRLDKSWIPNLVVIGCRKLARILKSEQTV